VIRKMSIFQGFHLLPVLRRKIISQAICCMLLFLFRIVFILVLLFMPFDATAVEILSFFSLVLREVVLCLLLMFIVTSKISAARPPQAVDHPLQPKALPLSQHDQESAVRNPKDRTDFVDY
jgi:hypothetical protein